jgi:hypothetical protein
MRLVAIGGSDAGISAALRARELRSHEPRLDRDVPRHGCSTLSVRSGPWGTTEREVPLSPTRLRSCRCETCAVVQRPAVRFACIATLRDPSRAPPCGSLRPARWDLPLTASPMCGDGRRDATTCGNRPPYPSGWRSPCAFRRARGAGKIPAQRRHDVVGHLRSPPVPTRQHSG